MPYGSVTPVTPQWVRSSRCVSDQHCAEIAKLDGKIGFRCSTDPARTLMLSLDQWRAFVTAVKTGAFD